MQSSYVEQLVLRFPELKEQQKAIQDFCDLIVESYHKDGKILLCGSGGSAADSEHITGELLKGFITKRPMSQEKIEHFNKYFENETDAKMLQQGIPAVPIVSLMSGLTAFINDVSPELAFAQMVFAMGKKVDLLVVVSTSGNSVNTVKAAQVAKAMGIKTVALVGKTGGKLKDICDVSIVAPANETYRVQEYHLPIYHAVCAEVERVLFPQ